MHETPSRPSDSMAAGPDDPLIGVYVLSQFVFCARAGICAYENRQEHEEEDDPVNLDYLPRYDLVRLHERMNACLRSLLWQTVLLLGIIAVVYYVTHRVDPNLVVLGLAVVPLLFGPVYQTGCEIADVLMAIVAHRHAVAKEPDPNSDQFQSVDWCEMLKAGFISVPYKDRVRNDAWKLEGRPWRVLRRGNMRIPVFIQSEGDDKPHAKHLAKAAAYCFLLQTVEPVEGPYALVLKRNSFAGTTVPNHPRTRKVFHEGLRKARRVIKDIKAGAPAPPPEVESRCKGCPLGKPEVYKPSESVHHANGIPLPVFEVTADGKRIHHSHCGDRFCWLPPHERALDRDMRQV